MMTYIRNYVERTCVSVSPGTRWKEGEKEEDRAKNKEAFLLRQSRKRFSTAVIHWRLYPTRRSTARRDYERSRV